MQREIPYGFTVDVTYVGRRGLYLQRERDVDQLPLGTIQANPGVNIAALRRKPVPAIRQTEKPAVPSTTACSSASIGVIATG